MRTVLSVPSPPQGNVWLMTSELYYRGATDLSLVPLERSIQDLHLPVELAEVCCNYIAFPLSPLPVCFPHSLTGIVPENKTVFWAISESIFQKIWSERVDMSIYYISIEIPQILSRLVLGDGTLENFKFPHYIVLLL